MSRQRSRINRRANLRQDRAPERQVFPRGGVPGNGAQARGRVAEVVGRSISVEDATLPGSRTVRTSMQPTDGMAAALQGGFEGVNQRLDRLITTVRQGHGLDVADEELALLREDNEKLVEDNEEMARDLEAAQQHLRALAAQQGAVAQPTPTTVAPAPEPTPENATPSQNPDTKAPEDTAS